MAKNGVFVDVIMLRFRDEEIILDYPDGRYIPSQVSL